MTAYLLYRHGSNAANQGMCNKRPVAIVEAKSAAEAAEREGDAADLHAPEWAKLAPRVTLWANQYLSAVPLSRARKADVDAVTRWRAP